MSLSLIQTVTVGSGGATSITFSSIPQDGTDLLLVLSARTNADNQWLYIGLNGSIQNFAQRDLFGTGTGRSSNTRTDSVVQTMSNWNSWTSSTFSNVSLYFSNYTSSSNKLISHDGVTENADSTAYHAIKAMSWSGTSAISSLSINSESGTSLSQYTSASLYKITKA